MLEAVSAHYLTQQSIGAVAAATTLRMWGRMAAGDLDTSWGLISGQVTATVAAGQLAAANMAAQYLEDVLFQTGQVDLPVGKVRAQAIAGTASDGRSLDSLLYSAVTRTKTSIAAGAGPDEALAVGGRHLTMLTLTQVADANREAVAAGIGTRPAVTGYVRMLNPPSCARCVILAGKWFRWNQGFQRHPRCDCRHIPAAESLAGNFTVDPYAMFKSLSREEQDHTFGRSDARAIRDGADIYRVVNIKQRGLATATGARRYGTPSRLTVDDIYRRAGTRTNAIRMLTEEGYITGPQVAGGNLIGNANTDAKILAAGPGRGTYRIDGRDYETARSRRYRAVMEDRRDPLDRATMTAAERRIYDAAYRSDWANRGFWPGSVGANSADRGVKLSPITAGQRTLVQLELDTQLADLPNQPRQVHELARRLGLI